MENKGLLFIPDISGFTRFVNETDIDHSRLIIQELLELLINANQTGLEISEIEGDAILFYKFGKAPSMDELYQQVEKMFCAFHTHLVTYDQNRFCQCRACIAAVQLTLKVITHYGEFTSYNVRNFSKLIGKDIIVAHQLLKNDIDQHEYWLVTKDLLPEQQPADYKKWMTWRSSTKKTESGEVPFVYTQLSELKKGLQPSSALPARVANQEKVISLTADYETDIITLFHATGDFHYRPRWREGVRSVEDAGDLLPRIGMHCRCITDEGETKLFASSYHYTPERISFAESGEQDKNTTHYLLEKKDNNTTRLTIDFYIKKNRAAAWLFRLTKRKQLKNNLRQSMQNLHTFLREFDWQNKAE